MLLRNDDVNKDGIVDAGLLRGNVEYPYLLYGVKIYQVEVTPSEHLRKEGKIK